MLTHQFEQVEDGVRITLEYRKKEMTFSCTIQQYHDGLARYNQGAMIQDAFHFLTSQEREFLLTGISAEEWDRLFGE